MRVMAIDLETYSEADLKVVGVYRYSEDQSFEIQLFSVSYDGGPVICYQLAAGDVLPESIIKDLQDPTVLKEAHNAQFERVCLSRYIYGKDKQIFLDPEQWYCTMAHAATLGLPGSLDQAGKVLGLSEDDRKLKTGKALIQYFAKPKTVKATGELIKREPWSDWARWDLYVTYNEQDVKTELAIEDAMKDYPMHKLERLIYAMDQRIADRGVMIDIPFAEAVTRWNDAHIEEIKEKAYQLSGIENLNSQKQLIEWFREQGAGISSTKKEVLEEELEKQTDPRVRKMIEYKLEVSKNSLKKYDKMAKSADGDSRVRGVLQYYGANRTGRWAGRLVQVQNLPRTYLTDIEECRDLIKEEDFETLALLHEDLPDTMKQLIRTSFIAPEGRTFVVCDYSAIEARVIAWLAREEWRQQAFLNHEDIYCASASMMFGVPVVKHGENGHLRQKGKIAELALGYQGGVGAMKKMGGDKMGLTDKEMEEIVKKWRKASPAIVKLWADMERCAKLSAGGHLQAQIPHRNVRFYDRDGNVFVQLPSGRSICYQNMRIKSSGSRTSIKYDGISQERKTWGELDTYGGKLTENIVQAIARDCLATAMLRLEKSGYEICFHVHDEVIIETDKKDAEDVYKDVQRIMGLPIKWAPGLVLTAEGFISDYYKKD